MKKEILDILYPLKFELAKKSTDEHTRSYQLKDEDVSGRNLAAGRADAFATCAKKVDEVIGKIININPPEA